jgi:endonuclease YncB( thermonuclease family)
VEASDQMRTFPRLPPRAALAAVAVLVLTAAPASADPLKGVATVIDGDTLEIHGKRIRLHGIDAPESSQSCTKPDGTQWRCGQKASLALQDKIGKRVVTCLGDQIDRYDRVIGTCRVGRLVVNAWLVKEGWAMAYRKYSLDYVDEESSARNAGRNIWSGTFVPPNEYRKQQKEKLKDAHKPGCDIKGNINRKGKKLYHLPGSDWYEKTRISVAHGEKWFCSEGEAKAAGFLPAHAGKPAGKKKSTGKKASN